MNGFAIEISLDNTGLLRLPLYQNSISSLIVKGDFIIGGTTAAEGLSPYIFTASLLKRELISVLDMDKIVKGQQAVLSGFCQGKNQIIYAGTMPDPGSGNAGGHLLQIGIDDEGGIHVKDLGTPVGGEGIYALLSDASGMRLYGITHPSGLFFSYDISNGNIKTFHDIVPSREEIETLKLYVLNPCDYLCRALIQDKAGWVYGSMPINKLFCFNPKEESFFILKDSLPAVYGLMMLGRIDSWSKSAEGKIYGGNAGDGQLFELNPLTRRVRNLGKPIMMNRIRGLTFGKNGKLYGIAGAPPGYTHLFSYEPENGFRDLGNPQFDMVAPGIEQGIGWKGYNIGTLASSEDGKYIVMGEDEALSQLLIYQVPEK